MKLIAAALAVALTIGTATAAAILVTELIEEYDERLAIL